MKGKRQVLRQLHPNNCCIVSESTSNGGFTESGDVGVRDNLGTGIWNFLGVCHSARWIRPDASACATIR